MCINLQSPGISEGALLGGIAGWGLTLPFAIMGAGTVGLGTFFWSKVNNKTFNQAFVFSTTLSCTTYTVINGIGIAAGTAIGMFATAYLNSRA